MKHIPLLLVFSCLGYPFAIRAQSGDSIENTDEASIVRDWKQLQYEPGQAPKLQWPQRKYDSPFFCDELIPYKDGYIINSIATSPGARTIDTKTDFYYFDGRTNKISRLMLPGVDTVESLMPDGKGGLFCAYRDKGIRILDHFTDKTEERITLKAPAAINSGLDTAKWVKFGYRDASLYVLTPDAVYTYSNNEWRQTIAYSLDTFYIGTLKYRRRRALLPTRNITVTDSCIWFLQEVVQGRQCNLFKLNLQSGAVSELFRELGYMDNYKKELIDYTFLPDGSMIISLQRLMGNYMTLKRSREGTEVWTFENTLKPASGEGVVVAVSTAALSGDTVFLAGVNGLYRKMEDRILPLMLWEGTHQTIREGRESIDFEFIPRNLLRLPGDSFLLGGIYGGLYIIDPVKKSIVSLDDVPYKKIGKIDLRKW